MPIAKESGTNFKPVPSGTHLARCFGVVSLGTQVPLNPNWKPQQKVLIMWELPHETFELDGKVIPMSISKKYTLSLDPKANLRKDLDSWRGRAFTKEEAEGFPVENVIGAPCQLSITHKPKPDGSGVFVNIAGVAGIPKGMMVPELVHEKIHYELDHGQEGNPVFDKLPEWIREVIKRCVELNPGAATAPAASEVAEDSVDDDVPF